MNKTQSKPFLRPVFWLLPALLCLAALAFLPRLHAGDVKLRTQLTIEAGERFPWPDDFLQAEDRGKIELYYAESIAHIDTHIPGTYPVKLKTEKKNFSAQVTVADTVAPQGSIQDLTCKAPELPEPEDFITEIQDETEVKLTFRPQPDLTLEGEQEITVVLTDAGGNETPLTAKLTLIFDLEPPVIAGVRDRIVYAGDTVAYRSGITVTDNRDEAPQLSVDSSQVDLTTPGEYTVTYTATDYAGNVSTASAAIQVREKQPDFVEIELICQEVDKILAEIIREDMTDKQKVLAAAGWIRMNCGFINSSPKDDWLQGAYRMMTTRQGDCFNYYSLMKLMLERMEIPNIDVVKVKNHDKDSNHYWSLVSVDGGVSYYHVDTTPRRDPANFVLVTDSFMDDYSSRHGNCFNRDLSLYPATPTEPCP